MDCHRTWISPGQSVLWAVRIFIPFINCQLVFEISVQELLRLFVLPLPLPIVVQKSVLGLVLVIFVLLAMFSPNHGTIVPSLVQNQTLSKILSAILI